MPKPNFHFSSRTYFSFFPAKNTNYFRRRWKDAVVQFCVIFTAVSFIKPYFCTIKSTTTDEKIHHTFVYDVSMASFCLSLFHFLKIDALFAFTNLQKSSYQKKFHFLSTKRWANWGDFYVTFNINSPHPLPLSIGTSLRYRFSMKIFSWQLT